MSEEDKSFNEIKVKHERIAKLTLAQWRGLPSGVREKITTEIAEIDLSDAGTLGMLVAPPSADHISTLALHRYHQRDWQSAFIGPTKYWFCEATITSLDKISVQIELTVDTGCSADIILPAKLLERLGSSPLSSAPVKATTGNGDVILKRYPPLMVSIPLYEPPASQTLESYQTTRDHQAKAMYLDAFASELQEEPFEDMFSDVGDQEIKSPPTKKPSLEGASVPLQPLTRHVLDAKKWLALIGLPGLQKMQLVMVPELHVLLPVRDPPERL